MVCVLNRRNKTALKSGTKKDEGKYSAKVYAGLSNDASQGEPTFEG